MEKDRTPPTHVLHLIQGLEVGGLEIMVLQLVKGLDPARFRASLCCFDVLGSLAGEAEAVGIPVHLLARRPGIDWRYIPRLARFLQQQQVHILHLHNPTAFFYGTLAGRLACLPYIIYTEHGRDLSRGWKIRLLHRLLGKMVDSIVVVAEYGRRFLVSEEGLDGRRITRIYNGIDPHRFDRRRYLEKRGAIRAHLGLRQEEGPLLGIVARLDAIKNHGLLLRAVRCLLPRLPKLTLLVIGEGPEGPALEARVAELGLHDRVRFLGSRKDVPQLLSLLDLFVLPSFSEGLSLTLVEASAAGVPIVATDVGGNGEVVAHGESGLLVPSDDPEALAQAMYTILSNPTLASQMGNAGRRRFEREFTLAGMVERYQALYTACLGGEEISPEISRPA